MSEPRRKFLRFAGAGAVAGLLDKLLPSAWAANWSKINSASGTSGTWRKLQGGTKPVYISVKCGGLHTVALRSDGLVFACGDNSMGQLGDNSTASRSTLAQITGLSNIIGMACGYKYTVVLRSDGRLFSCGYNAHGELGDGTVTSRSTFVQAVGVSNVVALTCGWGHTLALRADGLVFGTGFNGLGELGTNTISSTQISFALNSYIFNVIALAAGVDHSVALRSDGSVYATGLNLQGQLGDGSSVSSRTVWTAAIGISNVVAVAGGFKSSVALRADGRVFACGYNTTGQLGDNTTTSRSSFVQAFSFSNVIAVGAGVSGTTMALRNDGRLYSTGYGLTGQLGINNAAHMSSFVQAVGVSNVVAMDAANHAAFLRSDGLIFTCGNNQKGQLGLGDTTNRSSYCQVT